MNDTKTPEMIRTMLFLQDEINKKINTNWRKEKNPWHRAIWTECAELIDHIGWKWWKKKEPNIDQVKLEIIDIWHFGLSVALEEHDSLDVASLAIAEKMYGLEIEILQSNELINLVEKFALQVLETKSFDAYYFAQLMSGVGLSLPDLFTRYVQKNVLNTFRQDQGYALGTYVKIWNGREDNEWLVDVSSEINTDDPTYPDQLYNALTECYKKNT